MIMSNHNHTSHHHHHIKPASVQSSFTPSSATHLAKPINTNNNTTFVGVLTNTKISSVSNDTIEAINQNFVLNNTSPTITDDIYNNNKNEIESSKPSLTKNITSLMSCMATPNSSALTGPNVTYNSSNTSIHSTVIPTKLYVTNFPFTCTQRQIQDLFSRYGQVVECTLKKDYYAYIQYTNTRGSQAAFKNANGIRMLGRKLTVHLATSKKSQSHLNHSVAILGADPATINNSSGATNLSINSLPTSLTGSSPNSSGSQITSQQAAIVLNNINNTKIIHVRNFPEACSHQQIRECFKTYGEIVECLILHDSYAFVHFKFAHEARVALQATNNSMFMQSNLLVQYSRSKFKQQSQGSGFIGNQQTNQQSQNSISTSNSNENISMGLEEMSLHEDNNNNNINNKGGIVGRMVTNGRGKSAQSVNKQFFIDNPDKNGENIISGHKGDENSITNEDTDEEYYSEKYGKTPEINDEINTDFGSYENNTNNNESFNEDDFDDQRCDKPVSKQRNYAKYPNFQKTYVNNQYQYSDDQYNNNSSQSDQLQYEQPAVRTKLYVTNFPEDMDQEEMKQLFNNYGNVLECTIMWNQYAFVHFGSYAEAEKALIGIKGVQYKGYKISVQWSTSAKYQQPKQQTTMSAINSNNLTNTNNVHSKLTVVPQPTPTKILERPNFIQNNKQFSETITEKPLNAWSMKTIQNGTRPNEENNNETVSSTAVTPGSGTQSWASIMNKTCPIQDAGETLPLKLLAESTTKTNNTTSAVPGQFKISFSEMVRSSNAMSNPGSASSSSVRGQLTSSSGSSLNQQDVNVAPKVAVNYKKNEQDKENTAVVVSSVKKIDSKNQKQIKSVGVEQMEQVGSRYLQENVNNKSESKIQPVTTSELAEITVSEIYKSPNDSESSEKKLNSEEKSQPHKKATSVQILEEDKRSFNISEAKVHADTCSAQIKNTTVDQTVLEIDNKPLNTFHQHNHHLSQQQQHQQATIQHMPISQNNLQYNNQPNLPQFQQSQIDLPHQHHQHHHLQQPAINQQPANFVPHYSPHSNTQQLPQYQNKAFYANTNTSFTASPADFYNSNRSLTSASSSSSSSTMSVLSTMNNPVINQQHHQHPMMINNTAAFNNADIQQQGYMHQQMIHNNQITNQMYQHQQYQNTLYHHQQQQQSQIHLQSPGMHQMHGMMANSTPANTTGGYMVGQQVGFGQQPSTGHHMINPHTLTAHQQQHHQLNMSQQQQQTMLHHQQQQMNTSQANLWSTNGFNTDNSFNTANSVHISNEAHLNSSRFKPVVSQNFNQQGYVNYQNMHYHEVSKYPNAPGQFNGNAMQRGASDPMYISANLKTTPFISASDCEIVAPPKLNGELVDKNLKLKDENIISNMTKPSKMVIGSENTTSNSSTPTPVQNLPINSNRRTPLLAESAYHNGLKPIQPNSASPSLITEVGLNPTISNLINTSEADKIDTFLSKGSGIGITSSLELSSSGSSDMSSSSSSSKSVSSFSNNPSLLSSAFNYSSYVLFPSDPFGLSETTQTQAFDEPQLITQQTSKQNSSYFPIEDVLANLMR